MSQTPINPNEYVIKTLHEMMRDRGYTASSDLKANGVTLYITFKSHEESVICFICNYNIGVITLGNTFFKQADSLDIKHIIVVSDSYTNQVRKKINEDNIKYEVELFFTWELMINITKHVNVPRHRKVEFEVNDSNYPYILSSDPVCKYYNFKRGDLIEISKDNEVKSFRLVR